MIEKNIMFKICRKVQYYKTDLIHERIDGLETEILSGIKQLKRMIG